MRQCYVIITTASYTDGTVYTFNTTVNSKSAVEATKVHITGWLAAHNRELISFEVRPL